ncbi:hypothetical protein E2562_018013 [Oryza meyeriana var. granulata]|uniref:Uncharacterized protein n=1 Tax=Oryza meyeriana var. granulata TaxID=110450 RepID=A0A6G1F960_9ORYZ|nr:hypothetical protein E2562_018013 [Oryza meyeriana var. granulata]
MPAVLFGGLVWREEARMDAAAMQQHLSEAEGGGSHGRRRSRELGLAEVAAEPCSRGEQRRGSRKRRW